LWDIRRLLFNCVPSYTVEFFEVGIFFTVTSRNPIKVVHNSVEGEKNML
jgi:hypothetical protein